MTTPAAMSSSANMEPLSAAVPSENHKRKAVASVKTQDAAESSSLLDEMLVATKIPSPFATQIRNLLTPTQIAELSRINDSLKLQATGSPFLDRFPREIRDKIYGYLLINPILGKCQSVGGEPWGFPQVDYELEPSILRTCKQINNEASEILYGLNKFYICCLEYVGIVSPLIRQSGRFNVRYQNDGSIIEIPAMTLVRHWEVFLYPSQTYIYHPDTFRKFCRRIHGCLTRTLTIITIPEEVDTPFSDICVRIRLLLEPLRYVRNLRELKFRNSSLDEIPQYILRQPYNHGKIEPIFPSNLPDADLEDELVMLATGDTQFERIEPMHDRLLSYARSFEQDKSFRADMGQQFSVTQYWRGFNGNPFASRHPVEKALLACTKAADNEEMDVFKKQRAAVLLYLEPQYQRMVNASSAACEFIKREKKNGGLFDPDGYVVNQVYCDGQLSYDYSLYAEAFLLLKNYDAAFERNMTKEVKIHVEIQGPRFTKRYEALETKIELRLASMSFDNDNFSDFVERFVRIFEGLDQQYLKMREARKALFDYDILCKPGCNMDVEAWRNDEKVDWRVEEPEIGPKYPPFQDYNPGHSESSRSSVASENEEGGGLSENDEPSEGDESNESAEGDEASETTEEHEVVGASLGASESDVEEGSEYESNGSS